MHQLNYYIKSVYGKDLMYFADQRTSIIWYNMTGRKTFEPQDMRWIEELFGTQFVRVFGPTEENKQE